MSAVELSMINLSFDGKGVFKDFSLKIEEGEKVLISGKSGNGKSTLIRIILGFQNFNSGKIFIQDKLVQPQDFRKTRNLFSYVNQDVTLRPGNVRNVLSEIAEFSGNDYNAEFDEELSDYFEFDMNLLDKKTEELSGGERQRLGIILAIMLNRPIFVLDEVTSALDEELKQKVVNYFTNSDKTVIAVSHDSEWFQRGKFRKVEW